MLTHSFIFSPKQAVLTPLQLNCPLPCDKWLVTPNRTSAISPGTYSLFPPSTTAAKKGFLKQQNLQIAMSAVIVGAQAGLDQQHRRNHDVGLSLPFTDLVQRLRAVQQGAASEGERCIDRSTHKVIAQNPRNTAVIVTLP